jgi:c-di-AMP phosphodiesterase-like protein
METFKLKAEVLARSEIFPGGVIVSTAPQKRPFMNLLTAQSADQMLDIKGIKASFVLGVNEEDRVVISARSLSDINVQLIMEKLGGGGHLTTAGAQVEGSMEEVKAELEKIITENMHQNGH